MATETEHRDVHCEEWELVRQVLERDWIRTVYIWGPPGVGKTYAAYRTGVQHFYACTLTEETSAAELRGHFLPRGGDTVWHDGPFVRAMREGARLVVNEILHASPDVLALFFPILESFDTARLTLPTGETLTPAPGFAVVVTDNSPPDRLPEPLRDRFMATLRVTRPHPDALAGLSAQIRRAAEASLSIDDERRVSARVWRFIDELAREFGLEVGCQLVLGPERGRMMFDAIRLGSLPKRRPGRRT